MEYAVRTCPREACAAVRRLREGIDSVLSRWHGLRLAVDNKWGGRDSAQKYAGLVDNIFSWFNLSGGGVCVEELESFLHESMLLTFNTEVEDGSIEDVAEQLMLLHEEYRTQ
ncbi:hypothetical protein MLD38_039613 [Melastoma candidum]|uniref:Uncharacterized protein n=1 Tax=Melastoma candidum TaxID=119954 RepID=A0ACB9L402_9MYRT|nr:hypothetical protein MLD38_039613 [Melastoma candidum]